MALVAPLEIDDWGAQSMPDASPVKWHLGHTTWFFERFVLRPRGIAPISEAHDYLFNSYYESVGSRQPRPLRGLLVRPTASEIVAYRKAIDARLADLEGRELGRDVAFALELGKNHEEQHQELLLTDVKHLFGANPLRPAYRRGADVAPQLGVDAEPRTASSWQRFDGGVYSIGHEGDAFAFDNEGPRHRVFTPPFELASRLVTVGEYREFIADGGYRRPELWLSDGWAWIHARPHDHALVDRPSKGPLGAPASSTVRAPLYWDLDAGSIFTLRGERSMSDAEPVCHVTYYEADAYARWAGARLPREAEWEIVAERSLAKADPAGGLPGGTFVEDGALHPRAVIVTRGGAVTQLFGDAWEWTASGYEPYPGFTPLAGAFAEYNGKFMVSQAVLRGGSCVTPRHHVRATYRNFFPPGAAWQFTGIRLARDLAS